MKTKFLLSVLATIFATAMSFTTARTNADPNHDYIFRNGAWQQIAEMNCENLRKECLVKVLPAGTNYEVFDSQSFSDPKPGTGTISGIITLP